MRDSAPSHARCPALELIPRGRAGVHAGAPAEWPRLSFHPLRAFTSSLTRVERDRSVMPRASALSGRLRSRQLTLYHSSADMTLFALYGVGLAIERTYHRPELGNAKVAVARPAVSAVEVRFAWSTHDVPIQR